MKIRITIGGNDRIALIIPIEQAGIAAGLLAQATVYERDGYYSTSDWKHSEEGVQISYTDATEFEPTHPKVAEAQKALDSKSQDWLKEYQGRQAAEKELSETKAALAALQSAVVCHAAPHQEAESLADPNQRHSDDSALFEDAPL